MALSVNHNSNNNNQEFVARKKWIGQVPMSVVAINPDKKHIAILTGRDEKDVKDPVYTGSMELDGKKFETSRIEIWCKFTTPDNTQEYRKATFNIRKQGMKSKAGKIKVIDEYGRTAWVTAEQLANKAIPEYQNGPAKLTTNYRPIYVGEENLTNFCKSWLNIKNVDKWDKDLKKFVTQQDPEYLKNCQARFEEADLKALFKNDFKCLQSLVEQTLDNMFVGILGLQKAQKDGKDVLYGGIWVSDICTTSVFDRTRTRLTDSINFYKQDNGASAKWIIDSADIHEFLPAISTPENPMSKDEEIFDTTTGQVNNITKPEEPALNDSDDELPF